MASRDVMRVPLPKLPPGVNPKDLFEALRAGRDPDEPIMGVEKPDPEEFKKLVRDMVASGEIPPESEAQMMRMASGMGDTTMVHAKSCTECNRQAKSLCSRCGVARFCSQECQRKAWPGHRRTCAAAAAVLAAPPVAPEIECTFRVDGEDEIPIPAGFTLFAVAARVAGLVVGKITGGVIDVAAVLRSGSDPIAAASTFGDDNGLDIAGVCRSLFSWGTGTVRQLGRTWPATADAGKEVVVIISMARVSKMWRRRGVGSALVGALLGHARVARHTLAALLEGGHEEDEKSSVSATLFFNACGFRPSPYGALPDRLMLRPSSAAHPARGAVPETEAEVTARYTRDAAVDMVVSMERAAAQQRGLRGAALRRHVAERALAARLHFHGPLGAAAHEADLETLRRKWPRAVAAARARGLPELHLLNVRPSRAGSVSSQDEALSWHMVAYDVFGALTVDEAAALDLPPHPSHSAVAGGPTCCVM